MQKDELKMLQKDEIVKCCKKMKLIKRFYTQFILLKMKKKKCLGNNWKRWIQRNNVAKRWIQAWISQNKISKLQLE